MLLFLTILNIFQGWCHTFESEGAYTKGPLSKVGGPTIHLFLSSLNHGELNDKIHAEKIRKEDSKSVRLLVKSKS